MSAAHVVVELVALSGFVFLPVTLTTSKTLRGYIAAFGILGALVGYTVSRSAFIRMAKTECFRRRNRNLLLLWIPFLVFVGTLVILRPTLAERHDMLQRIREILLISTPLPNFVIGVSSAFITYWLVGSLYLSIRLRKE
jgi:hypothetical protein